MISSCRAEGNSAEDNGAADDGSRILLAGVGRKRKLFDVDDYGGGGHENRICLGGTRHFVFDWENRKIDDDRYSKKNGGDILKNYQNTSNPSFEHTN